MASKNIAVLSGDGIGPEIMTEGLKVLVTVGEKYGHQFKFVEAPFGAQAYFDYGHPFPQRTKLVCDSADAILKGPIGIAVKDMESIPKELWPERGALLPLRERYDTYANFRPVFLPAQLASFSPLRHELVKDGIDFLIVRELTGGIYFGNKTEGETNGMMYARDECHYGREQIERIAHVAFKEARGLAGKLVNVHKKNVLATSRYWNAVVGEVAKQYADVQVREVLVDDMAFQLMKRPAQFNKHVILTENMMGDVLSDQAGGLIGSLGLMPSACVGPNKAYYEPSHGSAPDIAGQNKANPYAMIGSVAFMLEKSFGLKEGAKDVWEALSQVLLDGHCTVDLNTELSSDKRVVSTAEFGDLVVENILKSGDKK